MITIDVEGMDDAQRQAARAAMFMLDLTWLWPSVVDLFIDWMRYQFESEGAWAGAPWAPLSPGYLAWKTRVFPGKGILQAEGDLRDAASRPERIARAQELTLRIHDPKLQYHQTGTDKMPARPLLWDEAPGQARLELDSVIERETNDVMRRLGIA